MAPTPTITIAVHAPRIIGGPYGSSVFLPALPDTMLYNDGNGTFEATVDQDQQHKVTLDKQGISIQDGLNRHQMQLNEQGIVIEDKVNNHTVTLADKITINSAAALNIKATGALNISSEANVAIIGANISVEAKGILGLTGLPVHINP